MANLQQRTKRSAELDSPPVKLEIVDTEKRKGISNYYAYVICVTCQNGRHYYIYRRYRTFHEMQQRLEQRFLVEAGSLRAKDRTLPCLPGKIFVGRSAVRDVTDRRLPLLNEYLQKLYALPDKIRYDSIVLAFVRQNSEDKKSDYQGNRPAAHKGGSSDRASRTNGSISPPQHPTSKPDRPARPMAPRSHPPKPSIPLPRPPPKVTSPPGRPAAPLFRPGPTPTPARPIWNRPFSNSSSSSSSPSSYSSSSSSSSSSFAPSRPVPPPTPVKPVTKGPRAKSLYAYTGQHLDELSFPAGVVVSLVKRLDGEWFEGRFGGKTGMVPGNYLDIIELPATRDMRDDIQSSDEWDDSDDEKGKLTYYFDGMLRTIDVDIDVVEVATFSSLQWAIQGHMRRRDVVLNYLDSTGDLVEMVDDSDVGLMQSEGKPPPQHLGDYHAPWAVYVTVAGDHTPYRTDPY